MFRAIFDAPTMVPEGPNRRDGQGDWHQPAVLALPNRVEVFDGARHGERAQAPYPLREDDRAGSPCGVPGEAYRPCAIMSGIPCHLPSPQTSTGWTATASPVKSPAAARLRSFRTRMRARP